MPDIRIAVTSYPFRTNQIKSLYERGDNNVETNAKVTKTIHRNQTTCIEYYSNKNKLINKNSRKERFRKSRKSCLQKYHVLNFI